MGANARPSEIRPPPPAPQFDTRSEHNKAQAAVFDRPDIVRQFTAPQPPAMEARLAAIVGAVPELGPESRVIDAGCGTGCLLPHLQARGVADITAVDLSDAMLSELRARFPSPGGCGNDKGGPGKGGRCGRARGSCARARGWPQRAAIASATAPAALAHECPPFLPASSPADPRPPPARFPRAVLQACAPGWVTLWTFPFTWGLRMPCSSMPCLATCTIRCGGGRPRRRVRGRGSAGRERRAPSLEFRRPRAQHPSSARTGTCPLCAAQTPTSPPPPQHYSLARAAQLLKPGGYAVISHQEGRAWHSALRASSGPGLIPHELPDRKGLEALLFDSPFELVDLRDEEGLYLALLRVGRGLGSRLGAALLTSAPVDAVLGPGTRAPQGLGAQTAPLDAAPRAPARSVLSAAAPPHLPLRRSPPALSCPSASASPAPSSPALAAAAATSPCPPRTSTLPRCSPSSPPWRAASTLAGRSWTPPPAVRLRTRQSTKWS